MQVFFKLELLHFGFDFFIEKKFFFVMIEILLHPSSNRVLTIAAARILFRIQSIMQETLKVQTH